MLRVERKGRQQSAHEKGERIAKSMFLSWLTSNYYELAIADQLTCIFQVPFWPHRTNHINHMMVEDNLIFGISCTLAIELRTGACT